MPQICQSDRRPAFIEKAATSKLSLWLQSIAAMLERGITNGLVAFGEFLYPDLFETRAQDLDRLDLDRLGRTRFRHSGQDHFKRSEQTKIMPSHPASWHRSSARRRRTR